MHSLKLSNLQKTWIIDIDGTIFPHNGYLSGELEKPLEGVERFFKNLKPGNFIILLTSRSQNYRISTEKSLAMAGIEYDLLLMDMPTGERILINDAKPSGLVTAISICINRDDGLKDINITQSDEL